MFDIEIEEPVNEDDKAMHVEKNASIQELIAIRKKCRQLVVDEVSQHIPNGPCQIISGYLYSGNSVFSTVEPEEKSLSNEELVARWGGRLQIGSVT